MEIQCRGGFRASHVDRQTKTTLFDWLVLPAVIGLLVHISKLIEWMAR